MQINKSKFIINSNINKVLMLRQTSSKKNIMKLHLNYSIVLLLLLLQCYCDADPTDGFMEIPLNETNLQLQKPYDVPLDQRYSFINGTHRMWVYADDKPYSLGSNTKPRTEIRFVGLDYSSGAWQFEGHGFVPNGTSGATIAQIHGARKGNTTLLLRIYAPGEMRYYSSLHVAATLYDRWFRLNIIHDVDLGKVSVYLDGEKKFEHKDQGPSDLYFKCGVYGAPSNISYYMEARWRDLKIYYKK